MITKQDFLELGQRLLACLGGGDIRPRGTLAQGTVAAGTSIEVDLRGFRLLLRCQRRYWLKLLFLLCDRRTRHHQCERSTG